MKNINEAHESLKNLKFEMEHYRNSLGDKLEIIGTFIDRDLEDIASEVDTAIDRIEELERELSEANEKIEELEREAS